MRIGWPRRVSAQVLLMQVAIATGVTTLATGLFLAPLSHQLDDQSMRRALAIAQTVAAQPDVAKALVSSRPTPGGPVQAEAERVRHATHAATSWSWTPTASAGRTPTRTGSASTSRPTRASRSAGREIMQIDSGTLGRSARGKVPLRDAHRRIVGAVSVGIAYDGVHDRLLGAVPGLLHTRAPRWRWACWRRCGARGGSSGRTHGLAFADMSALLDEREAMLHGIREGVVALDAAGQGAAGQRRGAAAAGARRRRGGPQPRRRAAGGPHHRRAGRPGRGTDLLTVSGGRVLVANRMPTEDGGAVVTLRDRTELELLGRELDSTQGLLDALRAQDHEHANRLHTLLGLLELGLYEEAVELRGRGRRDPPGAAEEVSDRVRDPLLAALLVGKAAIAADAGSPLRISPGTLLPDRLVDPRDLVSVLGTSWTTRWTRRTHGSRSSCAPSGPRRCCGSATTAPGCRRSWGPDLHRGCATKAVRRRTGAGAWVWRWCAARRALRRHRPGHSPAPGGGAVFTVVLPEALARCRQRRRAARFAGGVR